ncbi:hypothetical protein [Halodesulfovibrio sp.]|jgi:hypothetical protein|uniref:hypothetical protein n=1 Tax=Halodesulfovibrio sp. TaxID=1912772 RepID=UPI0025D0A453|nr:hypothetical protein [Halodesulfovibrio sp.]MCT4534494.1 hypothetical protein [Halodesulfovibrio sp.]
MDWKELATSVAKVAPVLGAALGGPVGAIAGAAGTLISSFLGVDPEPQAVAAALENPQMLLKLKELEVEQQAQLLGWQRAQLEAELQNVQGARAREVALAKAGHGGAWITGMVSLVVICGFFWMLSEVVAAPDVSEPALLLLGSLGTAFGAVVNYYLGSSLGSYRKDTAGNGGSSGM